MSCPHRLELSYVFVTKEESEVQETPTRKEKEEAIQRDKNRNVALEELMAKHLSIVETDLQEEGAKIECSSLCDKCSQGYIGLLDKEIEGLGEQMRIMQKLEKELHKPQDMFGPKVDKFTNQHLLQLEERDKQFQCEIDQLMKQKEKLRDDLLALKSCDEREEIVQEQCYWEKTHEHLELGRQSLTLYYMEEERLKNVQAEIRRLNGEQLSRMERSVLKDCFAINDEHTMINGQLLVDIKELLNKANCEEVNSALGECAHMLKYMSDLCKSEFQFKPIYRIVPMCNRSTVHLTGQSPEVYHLYFLEGEHGVENFNMGLHAFITCLDSLTKFVFALNTPKNRRPQKLPKVDLGKRKIFTAVNDYPFSYQLEQEWKSGWIWKTQTCNISEWNTGMKLILEIMELLQKTIWELLNLSNKTKRWR